MATPKKTVQKKKETAKPNPLTKSSYAESMASRWATADALMGGSEAMREASDEFLPRHKNEDSEGYARRIKASFLLPVFAHAVENLTDTVFSNPLEWNDVDEELENILDEVDAEGNTIEIYAKRALSLAMAKGEVYLFADEPPLPEPETGSNVVTMADRRRAGARPYLGMISADNMLAYNVERRDGRQYCTYARWHERSVRQNPETFMEETVDRVIEWRIEGNAALWRTFEKFEGQAEWTEEGGELKIALSGKAVLPITRYRIGSSDSFGRLRPPLHGLAEKNIEHWQSASDQRAILTISRFPMLGGSGVDSSSLQRGGDNELLVGPGATLFSAQPDSEFYFVEPEGKSIAAGVTDLERLEKDMSVLAFQPLMRQQAGVTATTDALGQNKANSSLQSWSIDLGLALDRAVEFISLWLKKAPPQTDFKPNTEFGIDQIDAVRVKAIQDMRNSGDLSRPQFFIQMRSEGVLNNDFDEEANEAELESEGPPIAIDRNTGLPVELPGDPNRKPVGNPPDPKPNPRAA